jgi:hypothetical protein
MSGDQIGDSFSGDDSFDELDSSVTGELFESFEKSFLALDLTNLDSSSEAEIAKTISLFGKVFKRVSLNSFAILIIITVLHFLNLIYLSASDYFFYVFFGLIFLLGYFYPIRLFYGLFKNRLVFAYLESRTKIIIIVSVCSLSVATVLSAYPVMRDYFHYYIDSPGTCLMITGEDESAAYFNNVSCFSEKAFQVLDYEINSGEECENSDFSSWDSWTGKFCLAEKRPPTEAELEILAK